MVHIKWQRILAVGAFLLVSLLPAGLALAAPGASSAHDAAFSSCLQGLKEDLGTVLPGSWSVNDPQLCLRPDAASAGLIPVTGGVNNSLSWRDAGASAGRVSSGGWHDAGAGSR
jgi:hypothetical protein